MTKIITEPNSLLHKKSSKVKKFDEKLKNLAIEMIEIMRANDGVGLSAIQIGKPVKLCVIEYNPEKMDPEYMDEMLAYNKIPLTILVNPKITKFSKINHIAQEGCLSCPGKSIEKKRSSEVNVLAQDLNGKKIKVRAHDFHARVLQHEIDHTNGILITD